MGDVRRCEQCGSPFEPRREHARFCSARCRIAWYREKVGDPAAGASALQWSVSAMREAAGQLRVVRAGDRVRAAAVIGEMVWQVTLVDATLVRYHPDTYDRVLTRHTPAVRRRIEGSLGGLRFVRNRMGAEGGCGDFIRPQAGRPADIPVAAWTWQPAPEPPLESLSPRGRTWETARYRAYQAHLANRTTGEVFGLVTAFLELAASATTAATADGDMARRGSA
jgi:hypothetical protein